MRALILAALVAAPFVSGCDAVEDGGIGTAAADLHGIDGPARLGCGTATYSYTPHSPVGGYFQITAGAALINSQSNSTTPRTASVTGTQGTQFTISYKRTSDGFVLATAVVDAGVTLPTC